jgi:hypothetical protein
MDGTEQHPTLTPSVTACLRALKAVDFELAYLALLTREGVKPLSRWEKPLGEGALAALGRMGLLVRQVSRTIQSGRDVTETVFCVSPAYAQIYAHAFAGRPIDKSPQTVRLEGFLFGYPPCCVRNYVKHPYAPNDLPDENRKILFHWACEGCAITPLLLPAYRQLSLAVESS